MPNYSTERHVSGPYNTLWQHQGTKFVKAVTAVSTVLWAGHVTTSLMPAGLWHRVSIYQISVFPQDWRDSHMVH